MFTYALVDSTTNIVQSFFAWRDTAIDSNYQIPTGQYLVEMTDDIYSQVQSTFMQGEILQVTNQAGSTFADMFTIVPPALSQVQAAQKEILQQSFESSLLNGFTSTADGTSRTYAIDPTAMAKWTGAMAVINSGKVTSSMTIKDFNGNKVTLNTEQFQQMVADGFNFYNTQEQHLWGLEDEVDAATTPSAVQAITW